MLKVGRVLSYSSFEGFIFCSCASAASNKYVDVLCCFICTSLACSLCVACKLYLSLFAA